MTLKKIDELLENAKKYAWEKVNNDPRERDEVEIWFNGYFMSSLFREIFKSKKDYWGDNGLKAFDKWSKKTTEVNKIAWKQNYKDIIKEFLNRR